jgi:hypothetical protein
MGNKLNEMCENCQYRKSAEKGKSPDLGEMLKLAMMVSKMFGQNSPSGKPVPEAPQQASNVQPANQPAVMNIDSIAEDKRIRIIKSALPFLEPSQQQFMHLLAKCLEIRNIMNSSIYHSRTRSSATPGQSSVGMLKAIRPHLDLGQQYTMDIACKALEMIEVMRSMGRLKSPEPEDENVKLPDGDTGEKEQDTLPEEKK